MEQIIYEMSPEAIENMILSQGIPLISDYNELLRTNLFRNIEIFSNNFLSDHVKVLKNYRWSIDPLHQWSRQWEYPFTYSYIRHFISSNNKSMYSNEKFNILDAGSGCTFFPYYISYKHSNCKIYCCDNDYSLVPLFAGINNNMENTEIEFNNYDLVNPCYKDDFFDIIYCISVLEHIPNYEEVIKQFKRIIKPNGIIIITFDISLDGKSEITIEKAQDLLDKMDSIFGTRKNNRYQKIQTIINRPDILTTKWARTFNENSLPWKLTWKSFLISILNLNLPKKPFFQLNSIICYMEKYLEV